MQQPLTSARQFFEHIVTPDYKDYYEHQNDIRRAVHICMSIDHLADWVAKSKNMERGALLECLYLKCPDLEVVRDLSCNVKHFQPTRAPVIMVAATAAAMTLDDMESSIDDIGDWDNHGSSPQIIAEYEDSHKIWLLNVIANGFAFWKKEYEKNEW